MGSEVGRIRREVGEWSARGGGVRPSDERREWRGSMAAGGGMVKSGGGGRPVDLQNSSLRNLMILTLLYRLTVRSVNCRATRRQFVKEINAHTLGRFCCPIT